VPEILAEVEAAALLLFILEESVPVTGLLRLPVVREMQRGKTLVGRDPDLSAGDLDAAIEVRILVCQRVEVAECDEGAHLEAHRALAFREPPRHAYGVLAVRHEKRSLESDPLGLEHPDRKRLEPELPQETEAFGVPGPRETVRREIEPAALHEQRLLELRQEHHAAHGRLRRGHEEAVIPARVLAGHGRHGVPAETVRLEPLARVGLAWPGAVPRSRQHRRLLLGPWPFRRGAARPPAARARRP
jgi:hypothetical protein